MLTAVLELLRTHVIQEFKVMLEWADPHKETTKPDPTFNPTREQLEELAGMFKVYDKNSDGFLSLQVRMCVCHAVLHTVLMQTHGGMSSRQACRGTWQSGCRHSMPFLPCAASHAVMHFTFLMCGHWCFCIHSQLPTMHGLCAPCRSCGLWHHAVAMTQMRLMTSSLRATW